MYIAEIKDDESGEIETGMFYEVQPWPDDNAEPVPGTIVSAAPPHSSPTYLQYEDEQFTDYFDCPVDKSHVTSCRLDRAEFVWHGGYQTPLAKSWASYQVVVHSDVLAALGKAGLKGLRAVKCTAEDDEGNKVDIPYRVLSLGSKDMTRIPIVVPPTADKCPFCGYGPIVCPGCGNVLFRNCPKCKKYAVMSPSGIGKAEFEAPVLLHPTSEKGHILDASRWDGTDFPGGIVTRRVVNALLSVHAFAFRAVPLRTYVGSCTKEQRAALEKLK